MKKLLFASACVVAVAAFGDEDLGTLSFTSFDGFTAGQQLLGSQSSDKYFAYEPSAGSTDGSTVKAFGNVEADALPVFDYQGRWGVPRMFKGEDPLAAGNKYLELSTEGGILWRGPYECEEEDGEEEGTTRRYLTPEALSVENDIFVDTMVQFTPTEDNTDPVVSGEDKLAIWLNVDSTNPDAPVTNLCVLAAQIDDQYTPTPKKFTIIPDASLKIQPGVWYRLTVRVIADITGGDGITGFMIYLDGKLLKSDLQTLTKAYVDVLYDWGNLTKKQVADIEAGSVFASLKGKEEELLFYGIGFKGSGAVEDLWIGTGAPEFINASAGSLDFTLVWNANVSAVSYTIGGTTTDITDLTAGTITVPVEAGETVTVAATAKDWYQITAGLGEVTVDEAKTHEIKTKEIDSPIAGELTADVKDWATAKGGLTPDQITACTFAKDAYLMNTDLSAAPGLQITSITEVENGWQITVKGTQGTNPVTLEGINGALQVKAAATLEGLAEAAPATYDFTVGENGEATITVTGDAKNFMKATVGPKTAPAAE